MSSKLDAALAYAAAGITVFPCHSVERGRCSCGKGEADHPIGKHPRTNAGHTEATTDPDQIRLWWMAWPDANIGASMKASGLIAVDIDPRHGGDESWQQIERELGGDISQTWTNLTGGGGVHLIYRAPEGFDTHTDNIAPGVDIKWAGYVILPPSNHRERRCYAWEVGYGPDDRGPAILPAALATRIQSPHAGPLNETRAPVAELLNADCGEGSRNETLASIAGYLRNEVPQDVALAVCESWNQAHCQPPLDAVEIARTVAGMYLRYDEPARVVLPDDRPHRSPVLEFPAPLDAPAFIGLAGRLIECADPCTEADPAAVLLTFLAMVGNAVGREPHLTIGTEIHRCNLFIALAGASGSGRKGTSIGPGRAIVGGADGAWSGNRITNGLVSGEGLIYQVRDGQSQAEAGGGQWRNGRLQVRAPDPGVQDKRLFCIEAELGGLVGVMHRQGSTLSPVIRAAWDGHRLESASKNAPVRATGAHISLLGHVTPDELRITLNAIDATNGFANRFLWAKVRRSKKLAHPALFAGPAVDALIAAMRDVLDHGGAVGAMTLDRETAAAYEAFYLALPDDPPGMAGVLAVRVPAFVIRLAMIYALLDLTSTICLSHLEAAMEVVRFCQESVTCIFGRTLGDPVADRIYDALQEGPLTRKQISDAIFHRNVSSAAIGHALKALEKAGLAYPTRTVSAGRPAEVWSAQ